MIDFIKENLVLIVSMWFLLGVLGLWIRLQTEKHLIVADLIVGILFGAFYFLWRVWDLDSIVIDLRKKR